MVQKYLICHISKVTILIEVKENKQTNKCTCVYTITLNIAIFKNNYSTKELVIPLKGLTFVLQGV